MKTFTLPDDHDLCIRTFLSEVADLLPPVEKSSVLHIGAHLGEEVAAYRDFGFTSIHLVEANPEILPALRNRFEDAPDVVIVPTAVGNYVGTTEFVVHKTKKGGMESSGLLDLERLGEIVPVFDSETRCTVPITTIDVMASDLGLLGTTRLLVLDIQGAELMAIAGAKAFLETVDAVICEVNLISNYQGCPLESDIDEAFRCLGFRKHVAIYHELYDSNGRFPAWGECLWINDR